MKAKTFIIVILLFLIGVIIMAGIVHKTVKSSGEKGLATEWNDDHEITGNIDVDQNQFLNQVIENRADFPAGPVEGQIIYRTDEDMLYFFDGVGWMALGRRINYWTCSAHNFIALNPDTDTIHYDSFDSFVISDADNIDFNAPVFLPHGAVVTAAVVSGDAGASTKPWTMFRASITTGIAEEMATASINTEDNTIANATIDNQAYVYWLNAYHLDTTNLMVGARITYTL